MNSIVRDYDKLGKRNKHAIESTPSFQTHDAPRQTLPDGNLIFSKRRNPHVPQTGSSISDGNPQRKILDENQQPTEEFSGIPGRTLETAELRKENTDLPEIPDEKQIDDFVASVHERIVRGGCDRAGALPRNPGSRSKFFPYPDVLVSKTRKFFLVKDTLAIVERLEYFLNTLSNQFLKSPIYGFCISFLIFLE